MKQYHPILIVMRLADMQRLHPRQDNSRVCSKCNEAVGIYPSGQAVLAQRPDAQLICNACYPQNAADVVALAPGALQEARESRRRE